MFNKNSLILTLNITNLHYSYCLEGNKLIKEPILSFDDFIDFNDKNEIFIEKNSNYELKNKTIYELINEYKCPIFDEIMLKLQNFGYKFDDNYESKIVLKFINIISNSKIDCLKKSYNEDLSYLEKQNWLKNHSKIIYDWMKKNNNKYFVIEKGTCGGLDVYLYNPKKYKPSKIFYNYRLNLYFVNKSKNNNYIRISEYNDENDKINLNLTVSEIIKKIQNDFKLLFSTNQIIKINKKLKELNINDKVKFDLFNKESDNVIQILKFKNTIDLKNKKKEIFLEVLNNGFLNKTKDYNLEVVFDRIEFNNSTILKIFVEDNIIKLKKI